MGIKINNQSLIRMTKRCLIGLMACTGMLMIMAPSCKEAPAETDPTIAEIPQSTLFSGPVAEGEIESDEVDEASGLAASRSNSTYLWTHNDSGGDPAFYLFTRAGADSGKYMLEGAENIDWEDMAIGPGPDDALEYLYAADIGDNAARRDSYTIYRVPEPDLNIRDLPADSTLTGVEAIEYTYADGFSRDAEAIMVDPTTKDIYVISKREAQVGVYLLAFPQSTTEANEAEFQGLIPFHNIVAADIAPSGGEILIKNYNNIYHWYRAEGTLYESMTVLPSRLAYDTEPQGEAIAWNADGTAYFTLSEEASFDPAVLYSYGRAN